MRRERRDATKCPSKARNAATLHDRGSRQRHNEAPTINPTTGLDTLVVTNPSRVSLTRDVLRATVAITEILSPR